MYGENIIILTHLECSEFGAWENLKINTKWWMRKLLIQLCRMPKALCSSQFIFILLFVPYNFHFYDTLSGFTRIMRTTNINTNFIFLLHKLLNYFSIKLLCYVKILLGICLKKPTEVYAKLCQQQIQTISIILKAVVL